MGDERRQPWDLVWSMRKASLLQFLSLVSDSGLGTERAPFATSLVERSNMKAPTPCGQVAREGEAVGFLARDTRKAPYCCRTTTTSHYRAILLLFLALVSSFAIFKTLRLGFRIPCYVLFSKIGAALILVFCLPPDWDQS